MCFFFHLKVAPERQPAEAQRVTERLAKEFGVYLQGQFPNLQVTNGHCSCDYIEPDGQSILITPFVAAILASSEIKRVELGWVWGEDMKPAAPVIRLSVQDFTSRNAGVELHEDVWYRLNDPSKYNFEPDQRAT